MNYQEYLEWKNQQEPTAPTSPTPEIAPPGPGLYSKLDERIGGILPLGTPRTKERGEKVSAGVQELSEEGGVGGLLNRVADTSEMITGRIRSGATVGLSDALDRILGYTPPEPKTTGQKIAAGVGELVGAAVPIGGLYKTVGKAAGKLVPKAATGLAARVGRAALPGAATGAVYEGARSAIEGEPAAEVGKEAALGAALFGGGDIALRALGKGVGAAWEKLPQATREALLKRVGLLKTEPPVPASAKPADQLALPEPEAQVQLTGPVAGEQRLLNAPQNFTFRDMTTEEAVGRVVPKSPPLLPEPQQNFDLQGKPYPEGFKATVKGPGETGARPSPPVKPGDEELLNLLQSRNVTLEQASKKVQQEYDRLVNQQVDYLQASGGKGVEQGGISRNPETGEVVTRQGRLSNNPKWYRDFYEQYGRAPRKSEYEELAVEQLRNGFEDDMASIPPDAVFQQVDALFGKIKQIQQDYPSDIIKPVSKKKPLELPSGVNFTLKEDPLRFKKQVIGPVEKGVATPPPSGIEEAPLRFSTKVAVPRGTERQELPRILAGVGADARQAAGKAIPLRTAASKVVSKEAAARRPESGTLGFAGARQAAASSTSVPGEATPVQRRAIVKYLETKLDIPIRVGRYEHRTALGIYKIKPEVIRTRLAEDLEVISHEVGHHLDKQLGLVKSGFDDEMKRLAAEVKGDTRIEGVAQFMNFYLTDPAKAKARAPRYYEAFEQKLAQYPEIAEVLDTAQQQIKTWLTQPSKARVLGSLSVDQGTPKRPMTVDRLYTMTIDELRPLEKAVKDITKGTKINPDRDPFIAAWLSRGWRGKAETALHYGQLDDRLKKIGPSLDEIMKPVEQNLDDFRAYITSKRSLELSGRGIETGIDAVDAGRALQEIEQELGSDTVKQFEGAFKSLVDFQDYILNRLVKSGMVGKDAAKTIRDMNRDYVPFYRLFDDSVGTLQFQGKTYANLSTPIKRLKGSGRTIIDPLESVIKNTFAFTNLAERNDVGRLFVELAESFGGSGKWIEKVATPMNATKFQLNEIEKALTDAGVNVTGVDLNKMAAIFRPGIFPAGKENIVTVYRNGRPEFFQLDPELYRAMLFLDKESSNILTKALSYPASVLRAGATLTPEFMARNPVRDQFSAFINSKYGFIPGVDLIKGLGHVLKKDELYWKWYQSGGAHSAFVSVDRDYLQKNLRTMLQKDLKSRAGRIVKNPLELLRALSEMTEEATRVQEFALGLKKGASPKEAALASRDITLDFGRAGTIGKEANRYITFLNSALQGADKMVRQWKTQPGKATFRAVSSITLPSVILYMVNRDNQYYQEVPQWEKDIYWMVPYNGGKNFIRIPKPFELGILFGTVPERFLAWADKEDPNAFKDLAKTVKEYVFLDMLPDKERGFGPGGIIPPGLLPTAFVPMLEVWANKSTFTGYPVIPQREQNLPPEMQYGPYTSEVAKLAGKATGTSPRAIEQAAFGYTAGLGRNSAALADWGLDKLGVVERTPKPAGELTDIPLIRGFISRNPTAGQSQSIDQFYEMYNETEQLYTAIRKKTEAGQSAPELNQQERNQLQKLKVMRQLAGNLSDLRKTYLQIQENKTISPQKKREALDILDLRQINLIRQAFGKEALK